MPLLLDTQFLKALLTMHIPSLIQTEKKILGSKKYRCKITYAKS